MPKEAFVPDIAQWYQKHDITALVYDTRTIGLSDGEPRHEVRVKHAITTLWTALVCHDL